MAMHEARLKRVLAAMEKENLERDKMLKTVDIRSPKTVISVHFSSSKPMAMQIY